MEINQFFLNKMGLLIGISITFLLGLQVKKLVTYVRMKADLKPPEGISDKEWRSVTTISEDAVVPTQWLGYLEQVLFFIAFSINQPTIIVGWLVFKLGSKWQTWQHIVKVPDELENVDKLSYLKARNSWGSNVLQRWLIGTLGNILSAFFGVTIGFALSSFFA